MNMHKHRLKAFGKHYARSNNSDDFGEIFTNGARLIAYKTNFT